MCPVIRRVTRSSTLAFTRFRTVDRRRSRIKRPLYLYHLDASPSPARPEFLFQARTRHRLSSVPRKGSRLRILSPPSRLWKRSERTAFSGNRVSWIPSSTILTRIARCTAHPTRRGSNENHESPDRSTDFSPRHDAARDQAAYWDGGLTTARRLFVDALEENPNQEVARRQLREIQDSTAPWVRVSSNGWHDDQPLERLVLGLESGWFPTPLTKLSTRVQPMQYRINDSPRTVGESEVAVADYAPRMRLETELAAGRVPLLGHLLSRQPIRRLGRDRSAELRIGVATVVTVVDLPRDPRLEV